MSPPRCPSCRWYLRFTVASDAGGVWRWVAFCPNAYRPVRDRSCSRVGPIPAGDAVWR